MSETPGPILKNRSALKSLLIHLRRDQLALIGIFLVVLVVGSAILAPLLVPHEPNKIDVRNRLKSPSTRHILGTDQLGRDV